ncbi:Serine/threonine-protein kinase YPK1 [Yarrowia sp. C11]|nr:Serine/threonine-protein kinase YPK1 [Yarrowia sp. E02]KAG5372040.1 Serine/threonine-protein kinase YPK1 [Yarrowia sp. C11]
MSTWKKIKEGHLSAFSSRPSSNSTATIKDAPTNPKRDTLSLPSVSTNAPGGTEKLTPTSSTSSKAPSGEWSRESTHSYTPRDSRDSRDNTSSSANTSCPPPATPPPPHLSHSFKPGLLTVNIVETKGLSLPPSYAKYASLFAPEKQVVKDSNTMSSARRMTPPPVYLVLEFDKTQLVLEATGGTLENPIWKAQSSFDVSRPEPLSINLYAKLSAGLVKPSEMEGLGLSSSIGGNGSMSSVGSSSKKSSSTPKYIDIFLGSVKLTPNFTPTSSFDGYQALSSGTGQIHLKLDYKPTRNEPLSMKDFELLKVIGKGSFGKVMQVRKKDTQQIYAIKTIRKARIVSRSEVTHTLAERTVLAQIDNPFIVPLKFSFQNPDKLYLVLAFVNGGELFHHLQNEKVFDLNRSRFYTAELLCALECLHEYNVIYRDLKPENILLDYVGHIALCDFGLCKLNMEGQEKTNTFCGTPEYLSPEILLGHGYTKTVDWWTLGVLLYEMLTGLPPFYSENTNEMYQRILNDPLRFPDDMDREARSILTGLLNRDPKKRLGVNGAAEIKAHPFFNEIDWKRLMAKKYTAPFKPSVRSATDTSNFDREFTSEVPSDSVANDYLSESVQKQFGGWTFTEKNEHMH